jgi:hypothetical protein
LIAIILARGMTVNFRKIGFKLFYFMKNIFTKVLPQIVIPNRAQNKKGQTKLLFELT